MPVKGWGPSAANRSATPSSPYRPPLPASKRLSPSSELCKKWTLEEVRIRGAHLRTDCARAHGNAA